MFEKPIRSTEGVYSGSSDPAAENSTRSREGVYQEGVYPYKTPGYVEEGIDKLYKLADKLIDKRLAEKDPILWMDDISQVVYPIGYSGYFMLVRPELVYHLIWRLRTNETRNQNKSVDPVRLARKRRAIWPG